MTFEQSVEELTKHLTAVSLFLGVVLGFFQYFHYRSRREKSEAVGKAFHEVVKGLGSEVELERLAAAVRLRRFFDRATEQGEGKLPYATVSANVIAAILRTEATGTFQKLLADGLAYAPDLRRADLQRTNLQDAYLGVRQVDRWRWFPFAARQVRVDLTGADFYRADLCGASLKGANLTKAQFYQARLHETVLSKANLTEAYLFEADLTGAKLDGATLAKAQFLNVRGLPEEIKKKLIDGKYPDESEPFEAPKARTGANPLRVFLSKPAVLNRRQEDVVQAIRAKLVDEKLEVITLERPDYPKSGTIAELRRLLADCSGAVVFGFDQLLVTQGTWRATTPEQKSIADWALSTPWNQFEAGMTAMLSLPILLVRTKGVVDGVFEPTLNDSLFYALDDSQIISGTPLPRVADDWCYAVRERARAAPYGAAPQVKAGG